MMRTFHFKGVNFSWITVDKITFKRYNIILEYRFSIIETISEWFKTFETHRTNRPRRDSGTSRRGRV